MLLACLRSHFVLNRISMPARSRMITFVLIGLAGFLPNMGLNGVTLRYSAPLFSIVWLHDVTHKRGRTHPIWSFLVSLCGAALCVALSAEIAIVHLLCLLIYSLLTIRKWQVSGAVFGALIAASALFPVLLPEGYYASLLRFSQGANNLPLLETSPHLLLYIVTIIVFVPKWLSALRIDTTDAVIVPVLGSVCLMMMPGALGRCDPYHVLLYGLVPSLLALAHLANTSLLGFRVLAGTYAICFLFLLPMINAWVHGVGPRTVARAFTSRTVVQPNLESLRKYDVLALPYGSYGYTKPVQQWLWNNRKVAPEYYLGGMGIYSSTDMTDRLNDLARFHYALILKSYHSLHVRSADEECGWHWNYLRKAFLYSWRKACVERAIIPDAEISEFLSPSIPTV